MDNWYYVGNFGQLGPLQRSDLDELIACGAIERQTYVWRDGMGDWQPAGAVSELAESFGPPTSTLSTLRSPPPMPVGSPHALSRPPAFTTDALQRVRPSPRLRVLAGILNILLPGVGRMYLGHVGIGLCQLFLAICTGLGYLWPLIDGVLMLAGCELIDGDGRPVVK